MGQFETELNYSTSGFEFSLSWVAMLLGHLTHFIATEQTNKSVKTTTLGLTLESFRRPDEKPLETKGLVNLKTNLGF